MATETDLERAAPRPFWDIDTGILPRWVGPLILVVNLPALLVLILEHVPAVADRISDTAHSLASYAIWAMVILLYWTHYRAQRRAAVENRALSE